MNVSGVDLRQETMLAWPCSREAEEGAETGTGATIGDVKSGRLSDRFEVDPTWSERECRNLR